MAEIVEKPKPFSATARDIAQRISRHENALIAGILIVIIAVMAGITRGATLTKANFSHILLHSSTRGIASIGQTLVILTAGIDVSVGGLALMCAILGASIMKGTTGFPVGAIACALLLGLGIGAVNGSLVSRIGMPALIVTLGMWQVTRGGAYVICRGTTIRHLPEAMRFFGQGNVAGVPVPAIIFIAVAAVVYFVLYHTTFGKSIYAVGGNPVSAWLSGINVRNVYFMVYVISGFLAAIAGVILMSRMMTAGMNTVMGLELDSIAAVCIGGISLMGGRGTLIGAVIGVFIIGVINNGMNVFGINPAYYSIVKGAIIIGAVAADYIRRR